MAVLYDLLDRWKTELLGIPAVDVERAAHHRQAIVDLRQLIASLEDDMLAGSISAMTQSG